MLFRSSGWRVGSSAVTGFLERAGVHLGKYNTVKATTNPYGSFEGLFMIAYQHRHFSNHHMPHTLEMTNEDIEKKCIETKEEFLEDWDKQFGENDTVAVKCLMGTLIPAIKIHLPETKLKVVWLRRNLENEALSLSRVMGVNSIHPKVFEWVVNADKFLDKYLKDQNVSIHEMYFDALLKDRVGVANSLCDYCEIDRLPDDLINDWFKPEYSRSTVKL